LFPPQTIDVVNVFLFVRERRRRVAMLEAKGKKMTQKNSNANMLSALTHVAIDTMRTLSVFVALIANKFFGLSPTDADAYASISIAVFTMFSTFPLFRVLRRKLHALYALKSLQMGETDA
jgi:Co/Zn/Cd efflux system component